MDGTPEKNHFAFAPYATQQRACGHYILLFFSLFFSVLATELSRLAFAALPILSMDLPDPLDLLDLWVHKASVDPRAPLAQRAPRE